MNTNQFWLIVFFIMFYYLFNLFVDNGGMKYPLLKILSQLIMLLFLMILFSYKTDFLKLIQIDKFQKKIDDYYKKLNN